MCMLIFYNANLCDRYLILKLTKSDSVILSFNILFVFNLLILKQQYGVLIQSNTFYDIVNPKY
jgi:hypothetical protein